MDKKLLRLLPIAACGNILCCIGDWLLSVFPEGRVFGLSLPDFLVSAPLWRFPLSAFFGSIAMIAMICGSYVIYRLIRNEAPKSAVAILAGAMFGAVPGAVFHAICSAAMWMFVKMEATAEARDMAFEFFKVYSPMMIMCIAGLAVLSVVQFISIVSGRTHYPRYMSLCNIFIVTAVLAVFKIPGAMNIGGAVMFGGIWLYERKRYKESQVL